MFVLKTNFCNFDGVINHSNVILCMSGTSSRLEISVFNFAMYFAVSV